jgi:polyisoprenoid-binding protein YceI
MKRIKPTLFALAIITFSMSSCGSDDSSEKEAQVKVNEVQNCVYTYIPGKSDLRFTAYKFLNKTGVGGTFSSYQVDGDLSGAVPKDIIESMSFSIPTSTVETNNLDRNKKIDSLFFGNLENTALLTGKVVQLNEENGMATLQITMNDITNDVEGKYTLVDNKFNFSADIDVNQWNAKKGLAALNEACYDLHTDVANGDTVSKLWPDVSLEFETILEKKCN